MYCPSLSMPLQLSGISHLSPSVLSTGTIHRVSGSMQTAKHIIINARFLHILCPRRKLRTICVKAKFFESKGHVLYREFTLYSSISIE